MPIAQLALAALTGWSAIGLVGSALSWRRRQRAKARRGLAWILGVWIAYLGLLIIVSRAQPGPKLPVGTDECFGTICYAVAAAEELPGFAARGPTGPLPHERLVRVSVRILNHAPSGTDAQPHLRATLLDDQGRLWHPVPGLTGIRLTAPVLAGQPVLSQPVFRVAADATGLVLILSKGPWQPGLLEIGNADSWMHRPTRHLIDR